MKTGKRISKVTNKIKSMEIIDGKDNTTPDIDNVRSIDDILGTRETNPFKATSLAEFERKINGDMNLSDLQMMATKAGLLPVYDKSLLKQRLVAEFKKWEKRNSPLGRMDALPERGNMTAADESAARKILKGI